MSYSNGIKPEAATDSQTQVIDGFKKVQTRLKTLILTLQSMTNSEKQDKNNEKSRSATKRESFFRELNQMRNEVTTYVNDIEKEILSMRPRNTNDQNHIDKAKAYIVLVQLTTEILNKLNELFTDIFDRFSVYIDQLWIHMINHDDIQAHRVTTEFNQFFIEKTSNSNKLVNDIQELIDDIDNDQNN